MESFRPTLIDTTELNGLFDCGICYNEINDPTAAPCGHSFCRLCIERWLQSNNQCPECKTEIDDRELVRNYYVDRMKTQFRQMKEKARNKPLTNAMEANGMREEDSPFIGAFVEALKSGLGKFQNYCEDVKREMEVERKKVLEKHTKVNGHATGNEELKQLALISDRENKVLNELLKEYKEHINTVVVEPSLLPIFVTITISSKGHVFPNIRLKHVDTLDTVKQIAMREMSKIGCNLLKWDESMSCVVTNGISEEPIEVLKFTGEQIVIRHTKIRAGCVLDIRGSMMTADDVCMTLNFDASKKLAFTYYRCNTCNINWICSPCIKNCHGGHESKVHIRNHVADRACCYCSKVNCRLPNKKNPKI